MLTKIQLFRKKFPTSFFREIGQSDNCFNLDDFCSQTNRDNSQPYFDRHEIPHDMTLYQRAYLLNKENSESSAISNKQKKQSNLQDGQPAGHTSKNKNLKRTAVSL